MSLYKAFETDAVLEQQGIDIEYGTADNGKPIRFKICRSGGQNHAYVKGLDNAIRPYRALLQNDSLDNDVAERVMRKVFCQHVLIGWENVQGRDGKYLDFSPEAAEALMIDLPDIYADLTRQAGKAANFRKEILDAAVKN